MNEARAAALVAIDWGTTSARAYRLDASGAILGIRSADLGIQRVQNATFPQALAALLGEWRAEAVPRIASGMIGSRQGWVEAPYVDCPAALETYADSIVRTPGGEVAIVPGARCRDPDGVPDVMRGEETELLGAIGPDEPRVLAVLPGTHSKWALVERGRLAAFATFMTGEIYSLLLAHSILGRMASGDADDGGGDAQAAFVAGFDRGRGSDALTHVVFGARTLALAGDLAPPLVRHWLSGVLIGHELAGAGAWAARLGTGMERVRVVGATAIAARYLSALAHAGIAAERGRADAAAHGAWLVARRAGLVQ